MTKSKIFFYFCLSFIFGIFLNSVVGIFQLLQLVFLIIGIALISVFWKYKKVVFIGFCLVFLFFGMWRLQLSELKVKNSKLTMYNKFGKNIELLGVVVKEPDIRERNVKLTVKPKKINEEKIQNSGNILITVSRYRKYQYGDLLKIYGKLKTPPKFKGFNYKNYLKKEGIYSVIYYPKIKLLKRGDYVGLPSKIYAKILSFKNILRKNIYYNLSPPKNLILGAMILGDKNRMTANLKEKLNIAGVRHITAISGMHIVILSGVLMFLLLSLGFWRGQAFYFSILFVFLFVVMTGAQPSAIRAGIMGGIFLLGQKVGRKFVSFRALVMVATLMLIINPFLLVYDVGFQLSFLAVAGIIYLSPIFAEWIEFVFRKFSKFVSGEIDFSSSPLLSSIMSKIYKGLREVIAITLAAQIFTLPLLIYNFGRMSLVAPITNILIIPVVCWIMVSGFIFSLIGIISPTLGWIFSFFCSFLLTYLIMVVNFFSGYWAYKSFENVHWVWILISYLILGAVVWRLNESRKLKFLNY